MAKIEKDLGKITQDLSIYSIDEPIKMGYIDDYMSVYRFTAPHTMITSNELHFILYYFLSSQEPLSSY